MGKQCQVLRVIGLTVLLILVSTIDLRLRVEAQPTQEIFYDDGAANWWFTPFVGRRIAVNFSLPEDWFKAKLLTAKFYIKQHNSISYPGFFMVHIYDSDFSTELNSINVTNVPPSAGWFEADLSELDIVVNKNFYVCFESIDPGQGRCLGLDTNPPIENRTWDTGAGNEYEQIFDGDAMIRAVVQYYIPTKMPDWNTSDEVFDLAVCADGSLVAAATSEGLKVFNASGSLLWSWSETDVDVTSVDVSDDGNAVAAAIHNSTIQPGTYHLLFWKGAKTLSGVNPQPDWSSENLGGWIGPDALAISGDGDQVVVVGTGPNVYYWNGSLQLTGEGKAPTWKDSLGGSLEHVDISDDGDIIAILGWDGTEDSSAYVYKDCKMRTGHQWFHYNLTYTFLNSYGHDMALSDSGLYLVVGMEAFIQHISNVYFFNTSMSDSWSPQWICELDENVTKAVDISSDGNTVVAVTNIYAASPSRLLIFRDSASKSGSVTSADAEFTMAGDYTENDYSDVSMDGSGSIAAGGTGDYVFAVNATTGEPLWYYNGTWPLVSMFVRVSEDGSALVSAGSVIDSLYYFGPETAEVTFDQHGVASDFTGPILNVDGTEYTAAMLPKSFT
ncbi:PQQ-binding-like beta-propeller repeat protein, partial [Candidatus Bathyarchaeota archaeon]|nr:PQQ-binding-like beta-propeller repeat protein [Candidatus Bathyarchaeota archaeon]